MTKKQFTVLLCSLALGLSALSSVSVAETIVKQREVGQVTLQSRIDPILESSVTAYHDPISKPTDTLEELVGNSVDIVIYKANGDFKEDTQDGFSYVIYKNNQSSEGDSGTSTPTKKPRITFETTELTHSSKADSAIELVLNASLENDDHLHLSQGAKTIEDDNTGANANITIDNRAAEVEYVDKTKVQVTLSDKNYIPTNEDPWAPAYLYIPISVSLKKPIDHVSLAAGDYEATITITEEVLEINP